MLIELKVCYILYPFDVWADIDGFCSTDQCSSLTIDIGGVVVGDDERLLCGCTIFILDCCYCNNLVEVWPWIEFCVKFCTVLTWLTWYEVIIF